MAKVTSKITSALERLRGSWEIVGDILIYNPSGIKNQNQEQSQFWGKNAMTLIHQRQYNVQPSALGKCNSTIISFHFCLLKLSQHSAELAMRRLQFRQWTLTILGLI